MTGDEKKENRWAKVLDDAGLLDDVDDAWELPVGDSLSNGATIEVRSSMALPPSISIESKHNLDHYRSRDEETQKVITVMSTDSSGKEEDTVRVSYADKRASDRNLKQERISKMPLSPVRRSEEPRHTPIESLPRTDTNPGQFAKHSLGVDSDGEFQPKYAATIDDNVGWDTLMDDDRPTIEVPSYSQRPISSRPVQSKNPSRSAEFGGRRPVTDVPSAQATMPQTPSLVDAVSRMQEASDESHERFVNIRGARISVQDGHSSQPPFETDAGSIVDMPISEAPEPIELAPPSLRVQVAEKYEMGDFSGALDVAEQILEGDPNNIDAAQYRKSCRDRLLKMYESRLGDMERVPRLLVSEHELMWRNLDASAGFVLSRIDGISSYDDIIDISGMPRFETCRILEQLLSDGLIE
ncbi:MAG: hypothetical protein JXX29_15715 [Deltaproteobacteria bacterium]|nr:hypothetical protein [Deltaproteobacteria bacterium]MBN2673128.1 hypothetical protein [Deltaproteobacteria bacterium]